MNGYKLLFGNISEKELKEILERQQKRQVIIDQFQKHNAEKIKKENR